jgi:hypothetical protein
MPLNFVTGSGTVVTIENPDVLIDWYNDTPNGKPNVRHGPAYYSNTNMQTGLPDTIGFADLGWAVLLDGRPSGDAALHLLNIPPVSLRNVPNAPLHTLNVLTDIPAIAIALNAICGPWLGCPIASKMAHPKRRSSIPVMDNRAIFKTFGRRSWTPWTIKAVSTVKSAAEIESALLLIHGAVSEPANQRDWAALELKWPQYTRIQLFDQCWWAMLDGPAVRARAGVTPP